MESIISSEQENHYSNTKNNHYFLKYNENLSNFISNTIEYYKKNKNKEIFMNSIFFNDDSLYLIFISYSDASNYLTIIQVTSQENNIKEIELIVPKGKIFMFGSLKLSEDKKHLVLFNKERNKIFIIFNYIQAIKINNKIILENYYENEKNNILDIKFNSYLEQNSIIDKDLILYGIYCDNNNLFLFNNKVLNKKFQIYFNEPFLDFQIISNINGGYDLYIMNYFGNFKYIKNINDIKNIPKSDKRELFQKIKIYDKIAYNINNYPMILNNKFIKCYFQPQNNLNEKIMKSINIAIVLRATFNILDIGVLINNNIFIYKKYYLNEKEKEKDNINEEKIEEIMSLNNILNKFIIKSNFSIYVLDIPNLFNLCLILNKNNSENDEQIKQEMLLEIKDIISKISLSMVLKLPLNNNNITIIYNFYRGSIFLIKNIKNNLIIRIYDYEIDDPNLFEDESNNSILKNNNKEIEERLLMEKLLKLIITEKEHLKKNNINTINKSEYSYKVLEEFSHNIFNLINNSNEKTRNINSYIEQVYELYEKLYISLKLYGENIKNENVIIKNSLRKRNQICENIKRDEENINKIKKNIEDKLKIIEENQNKIMKYRNNNNDLIYEYYLKNMNINNEDKNYANELVKRANNYVLKNIKFMKEMSNNNNISYNLDFEQFNNFPLTIKYLNDNQKKEINNIIDLIKKLSFILQQFHEQFKKK
jgi:hypothetical protein